MADDIICELVVDCDSEEKAEEIKSSVYNEETDNQFDFEKIIPLGENEYAVDKWGTKWVRDEECVDYGDLTFHFTTASDAPYPIVQEFCKKFKVKARMTFYDNDNFGANCGYIEVDEDGDIEDEEYFDSIEDGGLDFIAEEYCEEEVEFHGYKKDENGKWQFVEE